ncbi:MAG: hypothetical protein GXP24_02970 [Planctomycetes bacterium]|nr:hypothetical protein [Planctomycetota bacterium]
MSERERWIIYPLLFFALGAAVRDKILHRVDAKEIYCESLKIIDQQDPTGRAFVELGIQRARSSDPTQLADRVGLLRVVDSDGRELCHLDHNAVLQRVISRQLDIIDADNQRRVVVMTEQVPDRLLPNGETTMTSQGVIYLNNQNLGLRLAPPASRKPVPKLPPNASL